MGERCWLASGALCARRRWRYREWTVAEDRVFHIQKRQPSAIDRRFRKEFSWWPEAESNHRFSEGVSSSTAFEGWAAYSVQACGSRANRLFRHRRRLSAGHPVFLPGPQISAAPCRECRRNLACDARARQFRSMTISRARRLRHTRPSVSSDQICGSRLSRAARPFPLSLPAPRMLTSVDETNSRAAKQYWKSFMAHSALLI